MSPARILHDKKFSCEGLLSALTDFGSPRKGSRRTRKTASKRKAGIEQRSICFVRHNHSQRRPSSQRRGRENKRAPENTDLGSREHAGVTVFSGRWDESIEKDENGHFFIDQDYPLFRHMLDYLRNNANGDDGDQKYPVHSPEFVYT
jgi:hypothetical protein